MNKWLAQVANLQQTEGGVDNQKDNCTFLLVKYLVVMNKEKKKKSFFF